MSKEMGRHTPGPWRIGDAGMTVYGPKVDGEFPRMLAGSSESMPREERRANARLIAAAPELLEALKDALSQIGYLRGRLSDKERRFVAPTTNKCEEAAIAAIARAEGGAS